MPQVCAAPLETFVQLALPTCTGVGLLVLEPIPSWPKAFAPQHHRLPSNLIPHVCAAPFEMLAQLALPTGTGVRLSSVAPLPN
jgi:hypothetical protein